MKKYYFLLFIIFTSLYSFSQNDLCANAISITPSSTCVVVEGTFNGATITSPVPNCATSASQDVWYSFVATDRMMGITLFGTLGISNGFEVYENNCSGGMIICRNVNNASSSGESILYNDFIIGTTYLIRVFNAYSATTTNTFSLCIQNYPAPINDNCANAITLTPNISCVSTDVNLSGATLDGQVATSCSPNPSQDVWYKFVATDEVMSISLSSGGTISNGFEVYQNNCSGNLVICRNVNGNTSGEFFSWSGFVIGETYYVRVLNEYVNPVNVVFSICIQNYPAPANDECSDATTIPVNSTCSTNTVTLSGATLDGVSSASCSPNPSQDVWCKFIATNSSMTVSISLTSDISNGFQVYQNGCNGTMLVCRNANGNGQGETFTYNSFEVGQEYYIRLVNEYITPLTTSSFNVCVVDATLQNATFTVNDVRVFPNPSQELIYVEHNGLIDNYQLYNSVGQRIESNELILDKIDISFLKPGIYLLKLNNSIHSKTIQLVKK